MHWPATSKAVQARLSMARPRLLTCSTFARRTLILVRGTGRPPTLRIANNCKWHLFLSHTWAHGQDQAHKIKAGLGTSVKGMKVRPFSPYTSCRGSATWPIVLQVFLDVDDLEDISSLESYVAESASMLLFLTKSYFKSINCLREIKACAGMSEDGSGAPGAGRGDLKPLILVRETAPTKGGAMLPALKEECPEELREFVFSESNVGSVIPFYRHERVWAVALTQIAAMTIGYATYGDAMQRLEEKSKRRISTAGSSSGHLGHACAWAGHIAHAAHAAEVHLAQAAHDIAHAAHAAEAHIAHAAHDIAHVAHAAEAHIAHAAHDIAHAAHGVGRHLHTSSSSPACSRRRSSASSETTEQETRHNAASRLQRGWSESKSGRLWREMSNKHIAATAVQSAWRGKATRTKVREQRRTRWISQDLHGVSLREMGASSRDLLNEGSARIRRMGSQRSSNPRLSTAKQLDVVFPELYFAKQSTWWCCARSAERALDSDTVLYVSADNPGAAAVAAELQAAAPNLRLLHSEEAEDAQLKEATHFLLLLNRSTFVLDTDTKRPGEALAKQLREAFKVASSARTNFHFKYEVGARILHDSRGPGRVIENMEDGRTRIAFDSGDEHRYKSASMHKIVRDSGKDLGGAFTKFDRDGSGHLDYKELRKALASLGLKACRHRRRCPFARDLSPPTASTATTPPCQHTTTSDHVHVHVHASSPSRWTRARPRACLQSTTRTGRARWTTQSSRTCATSSSAAR